ncbi:hypothetical protein [Kribbella catacumbae]|uniref:hypothetical protein n=1 Tax=Kribbella catacumbae TaxID=460086 RepID=UPI00146C5C5A|nr:hypothetical protein [Kribbella catacumbae]
MGRRTFLGTVGFGLALSLTGCTDDEPAPSAKPKPAGNGYRQPAEGEPHEVTWMAYGATPGVWGEEPTTPYGRDLTNARLVARQDLVRLAATISRFEPVALLVNSPADEAEARAFWQRSSPGPRPRISSVRSWMARGASTSATSRPVNYRRFRRTRSTSCSCRLMICGPETPAPSS